MEQGRARLRRREIGPVATVSTQALLPTESGRYTESRQKGGSNSVVEGQLPKLDVAGSNPVSRSNSFGVMQLQIDLVRGEHP